MCAFESFVSVWLSCILCPLYNLLFVASCVGLFLVNVFSHVLSCSAAFCTTVLRLCVWSMFNEGSFCPAVSCWDRYSEFLLVALWTVNVQMVAEYFFVWYFIYMLNFLLCLCAGVCVVYRLMAGLQSVPAFPVVDFVLIWVGFSPLAICWSLCLIIVTCLLKDNLGFF